MTGTPDQSTPEGAHTLPLAELQARRDRVVGRSLTLSYKEPLHIVRGERQWLFDVQGRRYLDCVNNVCHVGHAHPRVVEAGARQMARLNTNTRYLHESLVRYGERLGALLPGPLGVCFLVNSGSEANELALRLASAHTGRRDVVVIDSAYHGSTGRMVELSPYKFNGPGGEGCPQHVHVAALPDPFRGRFRDSSLAGQAYAASVGDAVERAANRGDVAAFFAESILSCAGQIVPPPGYLAESYARVRQAGGLVVADEVQVGFGRVGSHFWGFELHGVVPDIVTLGKPMGNGHPLGAVITTPAVAASFNNGMEFFSTFGGNPVSCEIGLAVLDVIEDEALQANAATVGASLCAGLRRLAGSDERVGDVRGAGLFLGVELVRRGGERVPDADLATHLVEWACRESAVLLSTDGPDHNVIKIKPPLCFSIEDGERVVEALSTGLAARPTPR